MTIELLHPITCDGKTYSRGLGEFPKDLAEKFLALKDQSTGNPIARLPVKAEPATAVKVEDELPGKKKPTAAEKAETKADRAADRAEDLREQKAEDRREDAAAAKGEQLRKTSTAVKG
jgi:hypothetical protein